MTISWCRKSVRLSVSNNKSLKIQTAPDNKLRVIVLEAKERGVCHSFLRKFMNVSLQVWEFISSKRNLFYGKHNLPLLLFGFLKRSGKRF